MTVSLDYAESLGFCAFCQCAELIAVWDFDAGVWLDEEERVIRFAASCEKCRAVSPLPDAETVRQFAGHWHETKCQLCTSTDPVLSKLGPCLGAPRPRRVLVVCHGNLNRSAAGEIILRKMRPSLDVRSAGVRAKPGRIMAKRMREALISRGYCSEEGPFTRSTPLEPWLARWADRILVMDDSNEAKLHEEYLQSLRQTVVTHLGRVIGERKIPDPHFDLTGRQHQEVINLLERAFEKLFPEETKMAEKLCWNCKSKPVSYKAEFCGSECAIQYAAQFDLRGEKSAAQLDREVHRDRLASEGKEETIGEKMTRDDIFASGMAELARVQSEARRDLAGGSVLFPPERATMPGHGGAQLTVKLRETENAESSPRVTGIRAPYRGESVQDYAESIDSRREQSDGDE